MTRKSTRRLAVAIVAIMTSLIAPAIGPAAVASADPVYSQNVGVAHYERYSKYKVTGWECDVTGTWSTAENGYNFLQGSYSCQTGHAQGDTYVGMRVDPAQLTGSVDCGSTVIRSEVNIDEAGERAGTYGPTYIGENCGSLTQLCFTQGSGDERCVAFTVGAPPPVPEPGTGVEAGPCVVGGGDSGIAVTGEVVKRTRDVTAYHYGSTAFYRATFHVPTSTGRWWGYLMKSGTLAYPGGPYVHSGEIYGPDGVGAVSSPPMGTLRTGAVLLTPGSTVTVLWAISGERQTVNEWNGGITAAANEALVSADGTIAGIGIAKEGGTTWPNVTAYAGAAQSGTGPGSYAQQVGGITDPAACAWYWGTKTKPVTDAAKTDPIGEVPTEPDAEPDPPPSVYIGPSADCPEGTTLCVEQNPVDPPPNSVPDPESDSCDFSITDPATWGGQVICALVWAAKAIMGLIGDVLDFLEGLLGAVGNLLKALFIPDPTSWGVDGLMDQVNGRAPFSLFASIGAAMSDLGTAYGGAGSCGSFGDFEGVEVSACDASAVPGFSALRLLVGGGLVAMTGWYIFGILASLVRQE